MGRRKKEVNEFYPDYMPSPGETLLDTIEAIDMSQAELVRRTGRPKKTINEIIKGKSAITPDTAIQLERVLGIPASFWNNRQRRYDEFKARQLEQEKLSHHTEWSKCFPYSKMAKYGWIEESKKPR